MSLEVGKELYIYNRSLLTQSLKSNVPSGAVVLLQGANEAKALYDTNAKNAFQQHAFFNWTFGVDEPGCYGAIDVSSGHSYLFLPEYHEKCEIGETNTLSLEDVKDKFGVDACFKVNSIKQIIRKFKPRMLLTLCGKHYNIELEEREATFSGIDEFIVNNNSLFFIMSSLRLNKNELELKLLQGIHVLVGKALKFVIQKARPGMYDYQAEAIFKAVCLNDGQCRQCACFTPNCSPYKFRDGDMVVLNLRAKLRGYPVAFTQSFPANGKFTKLQTDIYTAVLETHEDVIRSIKPGVEWTDLLICSSRLLLFNLKKCGLLVGDVEDMMRVQLASVFQSRNIVSLIEKDLSLRAMHRMKLCKNLFSNMVLVVESSCYFTTKRLATSLCDPRKARFLVPTLMEQLNESYSVCFKNSVIVSEKGGLCFIKPKNVEQIERVYSL